MHHTGRTLILTFTTLVTLVSAGPTFAQDAKPLRSGLQPGDKAGAFNVQDVTGPRKGKSLCYACAFGRQAVVNIQAREMSPALIGMIKELDAIVDSPASIKGDSKHAFVVYITDDPEFAAKELSEIAQRHKIKNIPLTIFDELTGPVGYKLTPDAEVTIMMWRDTVVAVNHAVLTGDLSPALVGRVLTDARRHLGR